tara:strand:- start:447 stop:920 length:474 start_codon:yes stop_codon:yes gene_type:complete
MIITCDNCNKRFEINSDLIPDKGRLLLCGSCNHQWFFKKEIQRNTINPSNNNLVMDYKKDLISNKKVEDIKEKKTLDKKSHNIKNNDLKNSIKVIKDKKKIKILNLIIVFIVTFIAVVILVDTFEQPISMIIPNIEFILYNLYESTKDIFLFFEDLI